MTLPAFPPGAALDALTGALCKGVRRFDSGAAVGVPPPTRPHHLLKGTPMASDTTVTLIGC